nr:hypothetical protein Iba_chr14aCG1420 [Ipomoea batatas]
MVQYIERCIRIESRQHNLKASYDETGETYGCHGSNLVKLLSSPFGFNRKASQHEKQPDSIKQETQRCYQ